jgi:hypothetical protein
MFVYGHNLLRNVAICLGMYYPSTVDVYKRSSYGRSQAKRKQNKYKMGLTNAERQKLWRLRHPVEAREHIRHLRLVFGRVGRKNAPTVLTEPSTAPILTDKRNEQLTHIPIGIRIPASDYRIAELIRLLRAYQRPM